MSEEKYLEKSNWAVGGGTMIGLGIGFFLFEKSVFLFVGSIMLGIGFGLLVSAVLDACSRRKAES